MSNDGEEAPNLLTTSTTEDADELDDDNSASIASRPASSTSGPADAGPVQLAKFLRHCEPLYIHPPNPYADDPRFLDVIGNLCISDAKGKRCGQFTRCKNGYFRCTQQDAPGVVTKILCTKA